MPLPTTVTATSSPDEYAMIERSATVTPLIRASSAGPCAIAPISLPFDGSIMNQVTTEPWQTVHRRPGRSSTRAP